MDYFLLIPEGIKYPLTDLIIGFGFFFVLLLEKIVMRINKRKVQVKVIGHCVHGLRLFAVDSNIF
jgi:hypothetical protein